MYTKAEAHAIKITSWADKAASISLIIWLALVAIIYYFAGPVNESNPVYEQLDGTKSHVANSAACIHLGAVMFLTVHQLFSRTNQNSNSKHGNAEGISSCVIIIFISAITNYVLANYPTPVLLDQISGSKVYLLRWAEWTVLVSSTPFFLFYPFSSFYTVGEMGLWFLRYR